MIISLSSCEKHTEEILSDAKISEAKQENQIAAPSFDGVQLETITTSKNERSEERRFLSFKTVADFEKAMASLSSGNLEQWEKYFGFESARKAKDSEMLLEEGIEDEYLAAVLSPENVIQIGKWAFRIDVANEKVAVVEADSKKSVARLLDLDNTMTEKEDIMLFSTSDNIFADLEAGSTGSISSKNERTEIWGWFCKDDGVPSKKADNDFYYYGNVNRLKTKAVYQKAGVYFSIIMKAKIQWNQFNNGIWVDANTNYHELESDYNYKYEVRCGSSDAGSNPYYTSTFVLDRKLDHRVYNGVKGLKSFYASVQFYVRYYDDNNQNIQIAPRLTIQN